MRDKIRRGHEPRREEHATRATMTDFKAQDDWMSRLIRFFESLNNEQMPIATTAAIAT
jgi:hypothetical protein